MLVHNEEAQVAQKFEGERWGSNMQPRCVTLLAVCSTRFKGTYSHLSDTFTLAHLSLESGMFLGCGAPALETA